MNIGLKNINLDEADVVVIPVLAEGNRTLYSSCSIEDYLRVLKNKEKFKGENGEIFTTVQLKERSTQDLVFLGLGKDAELTQEKIKTAMSKAIKKCRELKGKKIFIERFESNKINLGEIVTAIVEGLSFGDYKFDRYKTDRKEQPALEICIGGVDESSYSDVVEYLSESNTIVETTLLARDLVNEPANVIYPESLAQTAVEYGKKYGFEVEVFDEIQIDELQMEAFMSVAQASDNPPRFIVMRYFGDLENKSEILGLVGKGLTYDSGGYSLKPNDSMLTMKSDMGGAAAVIGAISAISQRKLKVNVVAVVAACENMISGGAYKPGDIIGSMAGKTIEIGNTDAEGRLTLADAVHYVIDKEKASKIIDVATLTGAVLIALGTTTTGVVTNNAQFYNELETASKKSGENVWMLPAFEDYKRLIKSDIADLKNVGGRHAGSITAGLFIGEFVQSKPWLHLDIAGTAWTDSERDYYSKGGTGVGVRTLYYLAKANSK
jgi:leucyl aminopeptidase